MIVYPEVSIEWAGKTYDTKVTMKIINKIEQSVSLTGLIVKVQSGEVPLSHLAVVYGNLLRSAGVNASDDDVYGAMFGVESECGLSQQDIIAASAAALAACFPTNVPVSKDAKKK